jgi:NLI interacting factor-like phosphatase
MEIYGAAVTDRLDNNRKMLQRRFFRQHCTLEFGAYSKDLAVVNSDISRIFILDNSPIAYRSYPLNAIPSKEKRRLPRRRLILFLFVSSQVVVLRPIRYLPAVIASIPRCAEILSRCSISIRNEFTFASESDGHEHNRFDDTSRSHISAIKARASRRIAPILFFRCPSFLFLSLALALCFPSL